MPIIPNAIRKLRVDKRRTAVNLRVKKSVRLSILNMRKKPTEKNLTLVFSKLDKAVKNKVVHKNRAARLKSRLSGLMKKKRS